jgi:hypothetical protein
LSIVDLAIVVGIAFIMGVNAALGVAILWRRAMDDGSQVAPRTLEVIVRSMFMGEVLQEERMLVDATLDEPVELTLLLDERDQLREYL